MDRFWKKVDKSGDCWEWQAEKVTGYGRFKLNGAKQMAHRVSYELRHGKIPEGMIVMHSCDNPSCVNPEHLLLGTQKDNVADCRQKGRNAKGEKHGRSKLRGVDVNNIRAIYNHIKPSIQKLSDVYGVNQSTMRSIVSNKTWRHL